jgi:hypothetical protein
MKIDKKILIEEADIDSLYCELTDVIDLLSEHSTEEETGDAFVKREFSTILRLKNLLEGIVIGQQNTRVYERFGKSEEKPLKARFRVVRTDSPTV